MGDVTAALITGRETVEFRQFEQLPPSAGCLTIDIRLCGICGTDIASYRSGHLHSPAVCGHEWVGTIRDIGPGVDGFGAGDRVVVAVPPACGRCPECRAGNTEYCRSVSAVARGRDALAPPHGAFARSITVAAARVHPRPAGSQRRRGGAGGTSHGRLPRRSPKPNPGRRHRRGAGCRTDRLVGDAVRSGGRGGADDRRRTITGAASSGRRSRRRPGRGSRRGRGGRSGPNGGLGADVVLECAGVPQLLQTAVDLARSGGVVGLVSFLAQPATVNAARWLAEEITVVASNAFTHEDFRRSMTFLADGRVRTQPLHTRTVGLSDLAVGPAGPGDGRHGRRQSAGTSGSVRLRLSEAPVGADILRVVVGLPIQARREVIRSGGSARNGSVVRSGVVFYVIIFSCMAVLLVVAGLLTMSRNRKKLAAERQHESESAHAHRQQRNAKRAQSRKARRKRG